MKEEITQFEKNLEAMEAIPKNECEHNWLLHEQRIVHWYSWYNDKLLFYCTKCLNTAQVINKVAKSKLKD